MRLIYLYFVVVTTSLYQWLTTNISILLMFHEGCGLAVVLLVSAEPHTYSSPLARDQAQSGESGTYTRGKGKSHTTGRVMQNSITAREWITVNNNPVEQSFTKLLCLVDVNWCSLSRNCTLKSHQIWRIQCSKYTRGLRRKSGVAESSLSHSPSWITICFSF